MQDIDIVKMRRDLVHWYRKNRRELPWRGIENPYGIWVSEVMLQQTRVDAVIPYYQRFMARFPTVKDLAAADLQEVLKLWEGLGYYARARNLHRAAGQVAIYHNGILPDDYAAVRNLAGVGDYIAAAVMSIAFGRRHAVVDGNVKRVLTRLLLLDAPVNRHDAYAVFEQRATRLLDPADPGCFNQAVMELGALVCRPKQPVCDACPVKDLCRAFAAGLVPVYPKRIPKRKVPTRAMTAGLIRNNGKVLITQIPAEGLLGGLWEFPGGIVAPGESAEAACVRLIREKTGLAVDPCGHLGRIRHAYTHFKVVVDLYLCRFRSGTVHLEGPTDYRWIGLDELARYPLPKTLHKFMPLLPVSDAGPRIGWPDTSCQDPGVRRRMK